MRLREPLAERRYRLLARRGPVLRELIRGKRWRCSERHRCRWPTRAMPWSLEVELSARNTIWNLSAAHFFPLDCAMVPSPDDVGARSGRDRLCVGGIGALHAIEDLVVLPSVVHAVVRQGTSRMPRWARHGVQRDASFGLHNTRGTADLEHLWLANFLTQVQCIQETRRIRTKQRSHFDL